MFSFQIRINHWWPTYSQGHFLFRFFLDHPPKSIIIYPLSGFVFFFPEQFTGISTPDCWKCHLKTVDVTTSATSVLISGFTQDFRTLVNRICTWTHKWRGCIAFGLSHGWWRGSVANLTGVAISISPESWCFRFLSDTPPSLMCASCLLTTWIRTCFKTYQKLPLNIANSVKKAALSTLQCYKETQHIMLY